MGPAHTYGAFRVISNISCEITEWANRLGENTKQLDRVSDDPAIRELLDAIQLDKARSEEYFRLWYLRLWQALVDVGMYCTHQKVRHYLEKIREQPRGRELTKHRIAIAHWHTGTIDYTKVQDLHRLAVEVVDHILTHGE